MRALFRNDRFRKLWIAQIGLALGDAMMQMGLLEFFRTHGYNERVETAKLFFWVSLPGLLLGPVAMAYLDRWQRRSVMMLSDAARMVVVVLIALWLLPVLTGRLEERGLWLVYSMIFVIGAVTTFHYPARYALVPNLVERGELIQANTLFTTSLAAAQVGGRALGGFVAERVGVEWAVLANALMYVLSIGLVWIIRMPPPAPASEARPRSGGGWSEMKLGWSYLWQHPTALPLVLLSAGFAFLLGVFIVVIVGYAYAAPPDGLGLGTGGLGYLAGGGGVGAAVGVVLVGRGKSWTRSTWLPFAQLIAIGIILGGLSATTNVWVAAPLLALLGCIGATVMIPIDSKLQAQVDDERRGAVFAARGMLTSVTMLIAFWLQFGTTVLKERSAPRLLLWLSVATLGAAVLALLVLRERTRREAKIAAR